MLTLDPELAATYTAHGWWDGSTLPTLLGTAFGDHQTLRLKVHSEERPFDGSLGDVLRAGQALAHGLRRRGIGIGDAVAFQLPNWAESMSCFVGVTLSGAVLVPVAPYYGPKEVAYILEHSRARALIVPSTFRGRSHLDEVSALRSGLPALEHVIVVGETSLPNWATRFDDVVASAQQFEPASVDPASPGAIAWTSGTTASPKGVVLSHRALCFDVKHHMAPMLPAGRPRITAAPLSHVTGMLAAALVPPYRGEHVHLADTWVPATILKAMTADQVGPGLYAPIFATTLLDDPTFGPEHRKLTQSASLGGGSVAPALVSRLEGAGISVTRGYGCTEHPSVAMSHDTDPNDLRTTYDGRVLVGVEVRLVDDDDKDVEPGRTGEVWSRGPDLFSGYLDEEVEREVTAGGWLRTGDVAETTMDGSGRTWLRIVDRKKDIIIRAGINISPAEIEGALASYPGLAEVAVVRVPDERTGERACAVVRLHDGAAEPTIDELRRHLERAGLAKPKWPEQLLVTPRPLPRTPSGKVRKVELRAML